jgi:hypothetical protein
LKVFFKMKKFEIVGLAAAGCLWCYAGGVQLDWCEQGEVCRGVVPELPHGAHHDQRPWQPPQIIANSTSTASFRAGDAVGGAGALTITLS